MHCTLYIRAEENKNICYVPIIQNLLFGSLSRNTIRAIQIMLDNSFTIGDYISLRELVDRIADKKKAHGFMTFFLEENEMELIDDKSEPSQQDFHRACNVLEELYRYSQSLYKYPLGVFAINFE